MRNTMFVWAAGLLCVLSGCVGELVETEEDGVESTVTSLIPCLDTSDPDLCSFDEEEAPGGCFVTGIGHIGDADNRPGAGRAKQDSFGGNAMGMRDGSVRGQWQNTTHLGDLKAWAASEPDVRCASMEFDDASLQPTYRFLDGVPGSSAGLSIAARLGIDAGVVDRARELLDPGSRKGESYLVRLRALVALILMSPSFLWR